MHSNLFQPTLIDDVFADIRKKIIGDIDRLPESDVINIDIDQYASETVEKFKVTTPVLADNISYDEPGLLPKSDWMPITVYIPYTGDQHLFQCHGRSHPIITEHFQVQHDKLVLTLNVQKRDFESLGATVQAIVKRVNEGLQSIEQHVKIVNPQIKDYAISRLRERQQEIAQHKSLLGDLRKSGFSLRRRDDEPARVVIPVKPKPIAIQPKPSPKGPSVPELSLADYDAILQVIQDMVKVFERSPTVFKEMEEEHLRTILLVALNGVFQGKATGETFNGEGKTDILIRENNNNIFIAECLIWDGSAKFEKKITDQLFKYATWADSKLGAIVFNRKKNFTAVVDAMKQSVEKLPNRLQGVAYSAQNSCRHKFRRADDPQKEFILTSLAFEVPS